MPQPYKSCLLSILFLLLWQPAISTAKLPTPVKTILTQEDIPHDSLSILIQAVDSSTPLLAHNIDKALNPASVMKIVTTYAALQILGPDYQWKTKFYLDGDLKNGTLFGDLIVKGYGDPYMVEETLLPVLRSLRSKGLKHITGKLLIDNSYFTIPDQDPAAFDNRPHRLYNAIPSALMTNFQATRFSFIANASAGEVDIDIWPESPDIKIDNDMTFVKGKCRGAYRWPKMWFTNENGGTTARFEGKYSPQCGQHDLHRTVSQPTSLFYGAFYPAWRFLGGSISKGYGEGIVPDGIKPFHIHRSKSLSDIIRLINKYSNNVMTKQLLLTIAAETQEAPGTLNKGRKTIRDWMKSQSIDASHLFIDNGSGLSRDTRISANTLRQLMQHQWNSPWMSEMISSLSILGKDGTGKKRLKDKTLNGNMHLKTGILDHVRAMAGFYHSNNGKRYIVIALQNHHDIHKLTGTKIQDELIQWLDNNLK